MTSVLPVYENSQFYKLTGLLLLPKLKTGTMSKQKYVTAEEALSVVRTGDRVFIHGSAATPVPLVKALQARHVELHHVELISITTMGELDFDNPLWRESFFFNSLFVSANTRG